MTSSSPRSPGRSTAYQLAAERWQSGALGSGDRRHVELQPEAVGHAGEVVSVLEIHTLLRRAFDDAVRRGLMLSNPAAIAHAPKRQPLASAASRAWNAQQLRTFLDLTVGHRFHGRALGRRQHRHAPRRAARPSLRSRNSCIVRDSPASGCTIFGTRMRPCF